MILINIYVNTPLCILSQFDVSFRIYENGLKRSLRGERVVKENGGDMAMGAPHPGLRGTAEQTDAVGRIDMGSKTCMWPTVIHMQRTVSTRQRTGVCRQCTGKARVEREQCACSVQEVCTGCTDTGQ